MNIFQRFFAWINCLVWDTWNYYYDYLRPTTTVKSIQTTNQADNKTKAQVSKSKVSKSHPSKQRGSKGKKKLKQEIVHEPAYFCKCDITQFCTVCELKLLHPTACKESEKDFRRMKHMLEKDPYLLQGLPNNRETIPLVMAVAFNHRKCIKFLVKNGSELSVPFIVLLTTGIADTTYTRKIKTSYIETITDILINSTKEQMKPVFSDNYIVFPMLMEYHRLGVNLVDKFLKAGACTNVFLQMIGLNLSLLSATFACYNPPTNQNKYQLLELLLNHGTIVNRNIKMCDDIQFAIAINDRKALKMLLWYYIPTIKEDDIAYCQEITPAILMSEHTTLTDKVKGLNLVGTYGINTYLNYELLVIDGQSTIRLTSMNTFYSNTPLSLKSLSRLAVIKAMGPKFTGHYKKLKIPKELHTFLEFDDVDTFVE